MRHLSSLIAVAIAGGLTAVAVNVGGFSGAAAVGVFVVGGAVALVLALAIDPLNNHKRRTARNRF